MSSSDGELRRLGVMGGTFDPLHIGHLVAAAEALHELQLDRILFVPTGHPWQKRSFSDPEDRYLMTVLGAASNPRFATARLEIDREGPTYTADTMETLRGFYGEGTALYFIAGADAVLKLGTWRKIERLADLAEVVAVTRAGYGLGGLAPQPSWPPVRTLEIPTMDVSSTDIRARVASGRPIDYLVPHAVLNYIRSNGLYATEAGSAGV